MKCPTFDISLISNVIETIEAQMFGLTLQEQLFDVLHAVSNKNTDDFYILNDLTGAPDAISDGDLTVSIDGIAPTGTSDCVPWDDLLVDPMLFVV